MDVPLADAASVGALAARLAGLGGTVWTSPAARCRLVAEALGDHRVESRLQELDFGAWDGQLWDDVPRHALDAWAADPWGFAPPDGEGGRALVSRVQAFWTSLPPGNHVVLTHGGPLKVLGALAAGRPVDLLAPPPAPASITIVSDRMVPAL